MLAFFCISICCYIVYSQILSNVPWHWTQMKVSDFETSFSSLGIFRRKKTPIKIVFKKNDWFLGATFDLRENEIWSLWKYSEEKDWNFCPLHLTTVYKIVNWGKQWACFFPMCSEKLTGSIFNRH